MAYEDLTTFTEVDPNSHIAVTSARATFAALTRDEDAYVYKDWCEDYFNDNFEHLLEAYASGKITYGLAVIWGLANTIDDLAGIIAASGDELCIVLFYDYNNTRWLLRLREVDSGTEYQEDIEISEGTQYWLKVKRDESVGTYGTLYLYVYTDSGRTNQVGGSPVSIALHSSKKDFRYSYAIQSYDSDNPTINISGWAQNYVIPFNPPIDVTATDGDHSDKVVVTWTKNPLATGYQVYRDDVGLGWLDDVASYDDEGADAPTITPGSTLATDGDHPDKIALSLSGASANNGTTHTYKVKCKNASYESDYSDTDTGYRAPGALTYQWQRSAADEIQSSYSSITGATASTYDDEDAPIPQIYEQDGSVSQGTYAGFIRLFMDAYAEGIGRYYKCILNADGCAQQISAADRGYKGTDDIGKIKYQWQRSAADADADYSNITGATYGPYDDYDAPEYPAGRYYQCILTASGATGTTSNAARGYRKSMLAPRNPVNLIIRDPDGDTLAYIKDAWGIGTDYRINELGNLEFNIPAGAVDSDYLVYPNEVWLYINNLLEDIFKIIDVIMSRDKKADILVICKQVGYTLTKDIIPSYTCEESDGKKTSEILQEFLDYQEVERVTLGGVSPELDTVIAIEISGQSIWDACKVVRDTVGGYISVTIDEDDPTTRELWLSYELGENKGQQIRIGKNLIGLSHNADYIDYCNRLYPVGSSGLLLSTKEYTRQDVFKSSDASYGYLELSGLYSAYKDWTGLGEALPGHITVEKPTGSFVSPTGHEAGDWSNPTHAYDDNSGTFANYLTWNKKTWTPWLTLTHAAIATTQIKWWCHTVYWWSYYYFPVTQIDIYYGGAWHNVFNGKYSDEFQPEECWGTVSFSEQTITKVRIRFYNPQSYGLPYPQNNNCKQKDVYIWDAAGYADETSKWLQGANEKTLRCAIGDYDADDPYVVSFTHAPYLISLDDIAERADIHSDKAVFSTSDVDALISLGRTKLTELKEPLKSIDVDLIDLSTEEGRDFEELELGDIVTIIDEELRIEEEIRVVRISKPDLAIPQDIRIEIANKTKDIIDVI